MKRIWIGRHRPITIGPIEKPLTHLISPQCDVTRRRTNESSRAVKPLKKDRPWEEKKSLCSEGKRGPWVLGVVSPSGLTVFVYITEDVPHIHAHEHTP